MSVILLFLLFFVLSMAFLYNLVAAIYYNVKLAVSKANADSDSAAKKDKLQVEPIIWAAISLSAILFMLFCMIDGF